MALPPVSALEFFRPPETLCQAACVAAVILVALTIFSHLSEVFITAAGYIIFGAGSYHLSPYVLNFLKERFT